jgi:hypothetical protein
MMTLPRRVCLAEGSVPSTIRWMKRGTASASFRAPPDPPDGRGADPPREWSYELLFDDLPVPDPVLG